MKERIAGIYKILLLYEDCLNAQSDVSEMEYIAYLNRLPIRYVGINKEIAETIDGLREYGIEIEHDRLKQVVFHMIDLLKKAVM